MHALASQINTMRAFIEYIDACRMCATLERIMPNVVMSQKARDIMCVKYLDAYNKRMIHLNRLSVCSDINDALHVAMVG